MLREPIPSRVAKTMSDTNAMADTVHTMDPDREHAHAHLHGVPYHLDPKPQCRDPGPTQGQDQTRAYEEKLHVCAEP